MCANHPIDPGDMLAPIPTAVPPEAEETTEHTEDTEDDRDFATPDAVLQNPPFAQERPMSRVEAIQVLSSGLALADRRTRSAHLMAIHALAKRAAEAARRKARKEGGRHD